MSEIKLGSLTFSSAAVDTIELRQNNDIFVEASAAAPSQIRLKNNFRIAASKSFIRVYPDGGKS